MRIGLDLTTVADPGERLALAIEADRLGLWAVLVRGPAGTESLEAATIATRTAAIHLAVLLDGETEHPLTLAEEVAVLDHLSERRALAVVEGRTEVVEHVRRLLAGEIVDGVALSPPPAQTAVTVWAVEDTSTVNLTGDLDADAAVVDAWRDGGGTHLFVTWPGPLPTLARHLATRAAGPDFPAVVATMADRIDPPRS